MLGAWTFDGCGSLAPLQGGVVFTSGATVHHMSSTGVELWAATASGLQEGSTGFISVAGDVVYSAGIDDDDHIAVGALDAVGNTLLSVDALPRDGLPQGGPIGVIPWGDGRTAVFVEGSDPENVGIAGTVVLDAEGDIVALRELVISEDEYGEWHPLANHPPGLSNGTVRPGDAAGTFLVGGHYSYITGPTGVSGGFLQMRDGFEDVLWEVPPTDALGSFSVALSYDGDGGVHWIASGTLSTLDASGAPRWAYDDDLFVVGSAFAPNGHTWIWATQYDSKSMLPYGVVAELDDSGEPVWSTEMARPITSLTVAEGGYVVGCRTDESSSVLWVMAP
jgi:hypothetical protein